MAPYNYAMKNKLNFTFAISTYQVRSILMIFLVIKSQDHPIFQILRLQMRCFRLYFKQDRLHPDMATIQTTNLWAKPFIGHCAHSHGPIDGFISMPTPTESYGTQILHFVKSTHTRSFSLLDLPLYKIMVS